MSGANNMIPICETINMALKESAEYRRAMNAGEGTLKTDPHRQHRTVN
jgi:hypothetical protein